VSTVGWGHFSKKREKWRTRPPVDSSFCYIYSEVRINQTETALKNWRSGQVMSERLSAGILHLERYESVDPQHPLGGRDRGKDVVFAKAGERWIAACFFPPTEPSFAEIKTKFQDDLKGS
jgi:hypothetical protein